MSEGSASGEVLRTVAIDGHAHLRTCFDLSTALDHAAGNLSRGLPARGSTGDAPFLGVLLLAETRNCHSFEELAESGSFGRWTFARTAEEGSLFAHAAGSPPLLLAAGHQINTVEGLEVLSLGSLGRLESDAPIEAILRKTREGGGLAVLPWGFGKWRGRRAAVARRVVAAARPGELFLGDNGNRPWCAPRPSLFREAEARGLAVLPGSDPLPFPSHARRLGRYGFVLQARLDLEAPVQGLKRILRQGSVRLSTIGLRQGPLGFLGDQVRLRWAG